MAGHSLLRAVFPPPSILEAHRQTAPAGPGRPARRDDRGIYLGRQRQQYFESLLPDHLCRRADVQLSRSGAHRLAPDHTEHRLHIRDPLRHLQEDAQGQAAEADNVAVFHCHPADDGRRCRFRAHDLQEHHPELQHIPGTLPPQRPEHLQPACICHPDLPAADGAAAGADDGTGPEKAVRFQGRRVLHHWQGSDSSLVRRIHGGHRRDPGIPEGTGPGQRACQPAFDGKGHQPGTRPEDAGGQDRCRPVHRQLGSDQEQQLRHPQPLA